MKFTILIFFFVLPFALADMRVGFYSTSCPRAEDIIRQVVQKHFNQDRSITGGLLRMHFHDCFVRGCDASILIDSTKDIITLATRDAVAMAGGPRYNIATGRRDGLVSISSDTSILPGPDSHVSEALQIFISNGMTLNEMVTLLGAHTVGFVHCNFFSDRLNDTDLDIDLAAKLKKTCAKNNPPSVFLDQSTPFVFDNQFYNQILLKRGVLFIDSQLALDPSSRGLVSTFARNGDNFQQSFADAMIKMGNIGVLVNNDGEIRNNCRVFNRGS
ncbi:putative peroxidase [Lupinus albus]|uniref:peroxidase n=1 Tax=Lupinus albus TaxID=3870 RepID=A0A6A4P1E0_LUPAL|nr:putative peroxidase [Lupinus albus]